MGEAGREEKGREAKEEEGNEGKNRKRMCKSNICNEEVRLVEGYLGKDKKLYADFMDLEKAYDTVEREALWSVLRLYGVGGQLLKGIQAFYRQHNAWVRVGPKFSESFAVEVGVKGCVLGSKEAKGVTN